MQIDTEKSAVLHRKQKPIVQCAASRRILYAWVAFQTSSFYAIESRNYDPIAYKEQ